MAKWLIVAQETTKRNVAKPGVTLTEYAVIGAATLGVCVVAIALFGKSLNGAFTNFADSLAFRSHPIVSTPIATVASPPVSASVPGGGTTPIASQPLPVAGAGIVASKIATAPLEQSILTLGANGATNQLADNLIALANSLKASGGITDAEYNSLIQLANQGHRLGTIEGLIEGAAKNSVGGADFGSTQVQMDGKNYSIDQLVLQYGWTNSTYGTLNLTSSTNAQPETKLFMQLRDQALQDSHIASNPALQALVAGLSNDILDIAHASALAAYDTTGDGGSVPSYNSYQSKISISQDTHVDATKICKTGNGSDTGIQCQ